MIAVDTSVLIAHLRGEDRVRGVMDPHEETVASALVSWELWKGARSAAGQHAVARLLQTLHLDPLTAATARLAAGLHRDLVETGRPRSDFDTLIAAHAIWRGVPLATLDGGFEGIPGLRLREI